MTEETPIEASNRSAPEIEVFDGLPELTLDKQRQTAYSLTADPLFFKYQRGEVSEQEWLDAVEAVRAQYPYPEES